MFGIFISSKASTEFTYQVEVNSVVNIKLCPFNS